VVGKAVFEGDVSVSGDIDLTANASIGGTNSTGARFNSNSCWYCYL
jgi:hypothetical protein